LGVVAIIGPQQAVVSVVRHHLHGFRQISALHRSGAINRWLRSPFAHTEHDLPLPNSVNGTIWPQKQREIWRMSVQISSSKQ
jgi:hypothetical protein